MLKQFYQTNKKGLKYLSRFNEIAELMNTPGNGSSNPYIKNPSERKRRDRLDIIAEILAIAKGEILKRTRNLMEEVLWPYSKSIRYFELAKSEFNGQLYSMENLLTYCVWHTFFGKSHKCGAFQNVINSDWKWYSTIKIQEIDTSKDSFLYRKWWNGIEIHLNMAIYYTATAINSLRCLIKSS